MSRVGCASIHVLDTVSYEKQHTHPERGGGGSLNLKWRKITNLFGSKIKTALLSKLSRIGFYNITSLFAEELEGDSAFRLVKTGPFGNCVQDGK